MRAMGFGPAMILGAWKRLVLLALSLFVLALPMPMAAAEHSPPRIVAIGDLHGDYEAWRAVAAAAGLMDAHGRWAAGKTIFVQTGDVVDRGPNSLAIIHDLMRLQKEASHASGKVVALVGNHEAMNVTGDLRYVAPEDFAAFRDSQSERRREKVYSANRASLEQAARAKDPNIDSRTIKQQWLAETPLGWVEHRAAWSPKGAVGRWILSNPAVVLIDGSVFVHGGISPAYASVSLAEINRRIRAALQAQTSDPKSILEDELGPLWYRGLVPPAAPPAAEISATLAALGAKRIVVGHTPMLAGIAVLREGRVIDVDTAMSKFYGGKLSYLEIIGERVVPHLVERPLANGALKP
jgi:hypothetical protein